VKLYRYRPLNEFLYKELLYQEIYHASPHELNDPLDLNAQVNFYSIENSKLKSLSHFIIRRVAITQGVTSLAKIAHLFQEDVFATFLREKMVSLNTKFISLVQIIEMLDCYLISKEVHDFDIAGFTLEIERIISQFLNNSSISCFSETNSDFLMWSHYASSHTGICLEFEVAEDEQDNFNIPMVAFWKEKKEFIRWGNKIQKISYKSSLSDLDFYSFLPVFNNEGDVDLMNISKSYWHAFANELEEKFTEKLSPWASEREWRMVNISFKSELPEERIHTFDLDHLTGICFGANTPQDKKDRIVSIFNKLRHYPIYYQAQVDGTRGVIINNAEVHD
jgi:hypothetical protein